MGQSVEQRHPRARPRLADDARALLEREAAGAEGRRVRGVRVHELRRGVDAVVVRVAGQIHEHVAELVRERQAAPSGADAGAVEDDDVAHAREIAPDERLADAAAAGEERDDDDLDRARVAVVERLEERALLERARHRVHVPEVLEAVGQIDRADARRRTSRRSRAEPRRRTARTRPGDRRAGGRRRRRCRWRRARCARSGRRHATSPARSSARETSSATRVGVRHAVGGPSSPAPRPEIAARSRRRVRATRRDPALTAKPAASVAAVTPEAGGRGRRRATGDATAGDRRFALRGAART